MAQRAASYGAAVLHKSLTMKHCSAKAPQYEAASFHFAMKHSLRSYDVKMKNESFSVCNAILTEISDFLFNWSSGHHARGKTQKILILYCKHLRKMVYYGAIKQGCQLCK